MILQRPRLVRRTRRGFNWEGKHVRYVQSRQSRYNAFVRVALLCLETLAYRHSRWCGRLAWVLRPHLGFILQYPANLRPVRMEVSTPSSLLEKQHLIQPSMFSWDLHVTSSCHRIKIYSVNTSRPETARRLKMLEEHGADITNLSQPFELALESEEEYEQAYHQHPREPLS